MNSVKPQSCGVGDEFKPPNYRNSRGGRSLQWQGVPAAVERTGLVNLQMETWSSQALITPS